MNPSPSQTPETPLSSVWVGPSGLASGTFWQELMVQAPMLKSLLLFSLVCLLEIPLKTNTVGYRTINQRNNPRIWTAISAITRTKPAQNQAATGFEPRPLRYWMGATTNQVPKP